MQIIGRDYEWLRKENDVIQKGTKVDLFLQKCRRWCIVIYSNSNRVRGGQSKTRERVIIDV